MRVRLHKDVAKRVAESAKEAGRSHAQEASVSLAIRYALKDEHERLKLIAKEKRRTR